MDILALILAALLTSLVVAFLAFYGYRRFLAHRVLKNLDIPGPEPHWLFGNFQEFVDINTRHLVLPEWTKKYGKMYGFYEGSVPIVVISDIKLIQEVFVKQFAYFHGRKLFAVQPHPDKAVDGIHIAFARGKRWRRLRSVSNSTFSPAKMRAMTPILKVCIDNFMQEVDKLALNHDNFDISECFKTLSFSVISESAFGIDSTVCQSSENPILDTLKRIFTMLLATPSSIVVPLVLPEIRYISYSVADFLGRLGLGLVGQYHQFQGLMDGIIKQRKLDLKNSRTDLLKTMLELENNDAGRNNDIKGLTLEEIKAQSFIFMAAGYETTTNSLSAITYLLAMNPRVQEKLYEEIIQHFPDDTVEANFDSVSTLQYLDCVINEALRMFSAAILVLNRLAMEDTEIGGVVIPAGVSVQADVWSIHYDNDIYGPVDTSIFYPERFSEEYSSNYGQGQLPMLAFGIGPRICIGMRFALLEMKLTIVSLLRKYRIEKCSRTAEKLNPRQLIINAMMLEDVFVKLVNRKNEKIEHMPLGHCPI